MTLPIAGYAAIGIFFLSLAAKMYMSFAVRVPSAKPDYADVSKDVKEKHENASKAQLNVAEYEALFMAIFFFFYFKGTESILVKIVCGVCVLAQAIYFWGRACTGGAMPWAPMGALPRYIMMMIMIYLLYTLVGSKFGPGLAAVLILFFSLAAKLYMSFVVRAPAGDKAGYEALQQEIKDKHENASKAQLNVAEYEALFIAIFFFFELKDCNTMLVKIVCGVCVAAQVLYFWGRALTGQNVPWAPMGALPRYFMMMAMIYQLYTLVTPNGFEFGPGLAAVLILFFSLAAKMYMSFVVRVPSTKEGYTDVDGRHANASKAQLNVAEYEALFITCFLFFELKCMNTMFVQIVCGVCVFAQVLYFWGRATTGQMMPWAPMGALPRYFMMMAMLYLLYTGVAPAPTSAACAAPTPAGFEKGPKEVYSNSKYLANFLHGVDFSTCKDRCETWTDKCQDLCKAKKECGLTDDVDAKHYTREASCEQECVGFNMHGDDKCTLFADGVELRKGGRGIYYVAPGEKAPEVQTLLL
jgi:uncharacterized membrane protein YecN with MAPEG domain